MKLPNPHPKHLTYCLNVHPGETWAENFAAIRGHAMRVRDAVAPREPFGLGLRLGWRSAEQLSQPAALVELRHFLDDHGLYAFTINGFPYGRFHAAAVKEDVYRPDWRSPRRREYTNLLVSILAGLLPEGVAGSVSTVPCAYKPWIRTPTDMLQLARMLGSAAAHAHQVRQETGKDVCVALEPEPDCFLETAAEAIEFITVALPEGVRAVAHEIGLTGDDAAAMAARHIGVCLDTAHSAVEFEDPCEALASLSAAKVRVGKVQLSSALRLAATEEALARLEEFIDPVYLHQAKLRRPDGTIESHADLPGAILAARAASDAELCELRVHFHVPLFFTRDGPLASTSDLLGADFWRRLAGDADIEHLEIETYTFDVLPPALRSTDVVESIRHEYAWTLAQWATTA
jgi:sugar phosphate isomerase/epimerase